MVAKKRKQKVKNGKFCHVRINITSCVDRFWDKLGTLFIVVFFSVKLSLIKLSLKLFVRILDDGTVEKKGLFIRAKNIFKGIFINQNGSI